MDDNKPQSSMSLLAKDIRLGKSYFLLGGDAYQADKAILLIKSTLQASSVVDTTILYGDEIKFSALAEQLDAFSIFSSAKLVMIRNADKLGKKELEVLAEYFDAPSDIQSIIVIADKIDARLAAWKKIKANSILVTCDPPKYGGTMREWLAAETKRIGKRLSPKAAEEFISRIDLDYYYASNELTKLDLISCGRDVINETDVIKSLGTTRMGTLIDFYRALGKRNLKLSLEALQLMISAEWEALQVLFHFSKFYTVVWRILMLKKAHISDTEIQIKHLMDLYQSQRKEYMDFSRNFTLDAIEKIFAILLETDSKLKLSVAENNVVLTICLIEILKA
jgi:DNA polymerase III delta subunit